MLVIIQIDQMAVFLMQDLLHLLPDMLNSIQIRAVRWVVLDPDSVALEPNP